MQYLPLILEDVVCGAVELYRVIQDRCFYYFVHPIYANEGILNTGNTSLCCTTHQIHTSPKQFQQRLNLITLMRVFIAGLFVSACGSFS